MFRHNAGIYGVAERISFVHDDFAHFAEHYTGPTIDAVFLSPPWGGPGTFRLSTFLPERCGGRSCFFHISRLRIYCGSVFKLGRLQF